MLTKRNQQILNDMSKINTKSTPKHIGRTYILTEMRLNGFLEHVLLRLYAGFHSSITLTKQDDKNDKTKDHKLVNQISFLAHLGLINLNKTIQVHHRHREMKISIKLSSFGKAVMNGAMLGQSKLIRKVLMHKDIRKSRLTWLYSLWTLIELGMIITMGVDHLKFIPVSNKMFFTSLWWLVGMLIMTIVVYIVTSIQKIDFLDKYSIKICDILSICRSVKGVQQAKCEANYIVRTYQIQNDLIEEAHEKNNDPYGYILLRKPTDDLRTQPF